MRELARASEEDIDMKDGSTLANLIEKIALKYGEEAFNYLYDKKSGRIDPSIQFLVNGTGIRNLQGTMTKLQNKDVVAIIPPIGGG